jgi:tetratricopeptide (TPR) repeat protein
LRESLSLNRKLLGERHEQAALSLRNVARLYHIQCRYDEAERAYREALEIRRDLLGEDHLSVAETIHSLAMCLHESGDSAAAVPLLEEAHATYRRLGAANIPEALNVQRDLAGALLHQERLADASPLADHALARTRSLFGEMHWNTAIAMQIVGLLRVEQGRAEEAEPILRQCVGLLEQLDLPAQHKWREYQVSSTLGYCLLTLGRFDEAEPLLLGGYEGLRANQGDGFLETRLTVGRIVALYEAWGKPGQADAWRAKKLSAAWPGR